MTTYLRFSLLLLLALFFLSGCAAWTKSPPDTGEKYSYSMKSLPEGAFDAPETIAISRRLASFAKISPDSASLDPVLIEDELLALINEARSSDNISMLESEETMLWAARLRGMELHEDFSHSRANGSAYYTVFDEVGFSYSGKLHGENAVGLTFTGNGYSEKEIAGLMYEDLAKSPGHSRNMLRSQYKQTGVGVAIKIENGETRIMSSQLFASK